MLDLLYSIVAAALVVSALLWRRCVNSCLPIHHGARAVVPEYHVVLTESAVVDESAIRDASRCAHAYDCDLLEVLPCDLPAEELLAVMQMYSPARYRKNGIAAAVSAGCMLLVAGNIALDDMQALSRNLWTSDVMQGYTENLKASKDGTLCFNERSGLGDDAVLNRNLQEVFGV